MNTVKVKIENLNIYFKETRVLKNVSLSILKNKITAIIGPSGCGKSTLLRSINRMVELSDGARVEGKILLDGKNIYDKDVDPIIVRKKIGMVFQKPNPFPKSIYDNIAYALKVHGIKDKNTMNEKINDALKQTGLWKEVQHRLKENALSLSGGQQQRLCIARAIVGIPEVLLLDEPTSALDPLATFKIEDLLVSLKEKYTIVIVTHNMQQAARISDYTAFLYMGRLIEFGETKKIFTNPEEKLTEDYITGRFG